MRDSGKALIFLTYSQTLNRCSRISLVPLLARVPNLLTEEAKGPKWAKTGKQYWRCGMIRKFM